MINSADAPLLEVDILGPVQARRSGELIAVPGPKQQALLAVLALAGEAVVPVNESIEALWEDLPGDPRHALRAHVSRLRQVVGWDIEWRYGGYRLWPAPTTVDARRFETTCTEARQQAAAHDFRSAETLFAQALSMWRGEPFAGLPDTPALRPERVRLRVMRQAATADWLDAAIGAGNVDMVVDEARVLIAADPLDERHWGQLITALDRGGRRADALAEYQRLRTVLRDELGSEPGSVVRALHEDILREPAEQTAQQTALMSAKVAGLRDGRSVDPPPTGIRDRFVGCHRELTVMRDRWKQARQRLQVVAISGEPGIGKTRLATEFARLISDAATVRIARFSEIERGAFGLIRQWFDADDGLAGGLVLGARRALDGDTAPDRYRLHAALTKHFADVAKSGPLLLIADDAQWADPESARFLRHLVQGAITVPAMIVITVRDIGWAPGAEVIRSAVVRQSDAVTHVPLGPLGPSDVDVQGI